MILRIWFILLSATVIGCSGASIDDHTKPVDLTANVLRAGKPVSDVVFNLQPTGPGLPVAVPVVNGSFQFAVTPGTYTWYITPGASPRDFQAIPVGFHAGSMDRQIEVTEATSMDFNLD